LEKAAPTLHRIRFATAHNFTQTHLDESLERRFVYMTNLAHGIYEQYVVAAILPAHADCSMEFVAHARMDPAAFLETLSPDQEHAIYSYAASSTDETR
jgi:hypothetical protein